MWQYRLLLASGYLAFFIAIADTVVTGHYLLLASWIYTAMVCTHLGNGVALHRYFVHGSFLTTKGKHKILCLLSVLPGYGSPITMSMLHHHHHRHSDQDLDTHSPLHGFWHSWLLYATYGSSYYLKEKKVRYLPRELFKDAWVRWIHHNYYRIWLTMVILAGLVHWRLAVYFVLVPVAIGSLHNFFFLYTSHVPRFPGNYRNFDTQDRSQNNRLVSLLVGELHNNHHKHPRLYDQAISAGEFDLAGWMVRKIFLENDPKKQYNYRI